MAARLRRRGTRFLPIWCVEINRIDEGDVFGRDSRSKPVGQRMSVPVTERVHHRRNLCGRLSVGACGSPPASIWTRDSGWLFQSLMSCITGK